MPNTQFIAVCGASGGAGATTIAVNLAAGLMRLRLGRVLLLDGAVPIAGDASLLSGVESPRALTHLAGVVHTLGSELFDSYLSRTSSGVSLLNLCGGAAGEIDLSSQVLQQFLVLSETLFDFVVLDLGCVRHGAARLLLDRCDAVVLVSTPAATALVRARRVIGSLRAWQVPGERLHLCLNRVVDPDLVSPRRLEQEMEIRCIAAIPDDPLSMERALAAGRSVAETAPRAASAAALERLARDLGVRALASARAGTARTLLPPREDVENEAAERRSLKLRIHRRLVDEVDLRKADVEYLGDPVKLQELRERVEAKLVSLLDEETPAVTDREHRRRLLKELTDEALGLGPLEDLLADPSVTEILVNRHDRIYVERSGRLERAPMAFSSPEQVRGVIERIVSPLGRRIDEKVPMVDARLADGSRVNAIIPPLALAGPTLTIRKFSRSVLQVQDLIRLGTLNQQIALFLDAAVRARLNIVISGGTGSGKTTLLNVLSAFVRPHERIITIEDAAELRLSQEHVVPLEGRPPNIEGVGAITIRDLVRNALRMRPDRIIVGECRGGEALDMLQAMNTGHDGSLTTVHANSAHAALGRLETLALMADVELPSRAIRDQIVSAVQLIVHQSRLADGSRRITHVSEVGPLHDGEFQTADLFVFRQTGLDACGAVLGAFVPTGRRPSCLPVLSRVDIHVPPEIFVAQTA